MDMPDKIWAQDKNVDWMPQWFFYDPSEGQLPGIKYHQYVRQDLAQSLADALEFYADRANYQRNHMDAIVDVAQDGGERARAALANYRKGE